MNRTNFSTARLRQEEKTRLEEEKRAQKEQQATEKAKKDEERRVQKQEAAAEDARKKEEANAEKERRRAETVAEKERLRQEKEDKKKSKESKPGRISTLLGRGGTTVGAGAAAAGGATAATVSEAHPVSSDNIRESTDRAPEGETFHDQVTSSPPQQITPVVTNLEEPPTRTTVEPQSERKSLEERGSFEKGSSMELEREPTSPTKSRVKSWMKVRFGSKNEAPKESETMPAVAEAKPEAEKERPAEEDAQVPRTDSMRDVAMAGRTMTTETEDMYGAARKVSPEPTATNHETTNNEARARSPSISSLSSSYSEDNNVQRHKNFSLGTTEPPEKEDEQKGKPGLKQRLLKKIKPSKDKPKEEPNVARVPTNATDDEFEEARDQFQEETLLPPPPLSTVTGEGSGKKTLSPKGSREGSRFTEEL